MQVAVLNHNLNKFLSIVIHATAELRRQLARVKAMPSRADIPSECPAGLLPMIGTMEVLYAKPRSCIQLDLQCGESFNLKW